MDYIGLRIPQVQVRTLLPEHGFGVAQLEEAGSCPFDIVSLFLIFKPVGRVRKIRFLDLVSQVGGNGLSGTVDTVQAGGRPALLWMLRRRGTFGRCSC